MARRRSGRRWRDAFTLLELVIAMAIVLAVGALALPAMTGVLGDRAFDTAVEVTTNQLLLARAEAQRGGVTIEVRYVNDPPRIEARRFEAGRRVDDDPARGRLDDAGDDAFARAFADEPGALVPEAWAYRRLPDGLEVRERPGASVVERVETLVDDPSVDVPLALGVDRAALAMMPEDAPLDAASGPIEPVVIRLAVFLPDGSTLLDATAWMLDDDGARGARLRVNPWTGIPDVEDLESIADALRVDDEEDEDEEPDDDAIDEPADERDRAPNERSSADDDTAPARDAGANGAAPESGP